MLGPTPRFLAKAGEAPAEPPPLLVQKMVDFVSSDMLFIVEDVFSITGQGLVLTPGPRNHHVPIGSKIRLIRPYGSVLHSTIRGIVFETRDSSIGQEWTKADVPIGTEVWLAE